MDTGVEGSFQPKFQRVSTWALEVPECALGRWSLSEDSEGEHFGSGVLSEVSAKSQSVGTWEREVSECDHVGAEASEYEYLCAGSLECEYLDAGVSAKSQRSLTVV